MIRDALKNSCFLVNFTRPKFLNVPHFGGEDPIYYLFRSTTHPVTGTFMKVPDGAIPFLMGDCEWERGQPKYSIIHVNFLYSTLGPQNHEKSRFYTPNILVITSKNYGYGFPWYMIYHLSMHF